MTTFFELGSRTERSLAETGKARLRGDDLTSREASIYKSQSEVEMRDAASSSEDEEPGFLEVRDSRR